MCDSVAMGPKGAGTCQAVGACGGQGVLRNEAPFSRAP